MTPACAAHPQWTRLTVPPVRFASITPAPIDAPIPMAEAICSTSRPYSSPAAAAAPSVPQIEVAWKPCSKNRELRAGGVRGHAEAVGDLDTGGDGGEQLLPGGAGGLGDGERRGYHGRGRVQHRGQVGVVEVQDVGQRAVDQRGGRRRQAFGRADDAGLRRAAPGRDGAEHRLVRIARAQALGTPGQAVADHVEDATDDVAPDRLRQPVVAAAGGERRELLDRSGSGRFEVRHLGTWQHEGERAYRGTGGPDDVERSEHQDQLGNTGVEQLVQPHRLHDVDAAVDEQHPVHRQQLVTDAGPDLLERDRLAAGEADPVVDAPLRGRRVRAGYALVVTDEGRALVPAPRPPGADQHRVTGLHVHAGPVGGGPQVVGCHAVAGRQHVDAVDGRHVEQQRPTDERREGVDPEPGEPLVRLDGFCIQPTEQHSVV